MPSLSDWSAFTCYRMGHTRGSSHSWIIVFPVWRVRLLQLCPSINCYLVHRNTCLIWPQSKVEILRSLSNRGSILRSWSLLWPFLVYRDSGWGKLNRSHKLSYTGPNRFLHVLIIKEMTVLNILSVLYIAAVIPNSLKGTQPWPCSHSLWSNEAWAGPRNLCL